MTTNKYDGDPKLYVDGSGGYLRWSGGNPIMDSGAENCSTLSLLVKPGWPGNALIREKEDQYGSDFLDATEEPITVSMLEDVRYKAQQSLDRDLTDDNLAREVAVEAINPDANRLEVTANILAPGETQIELQLSKYGPNWELQHTQPAGARNNGV
jgi:hypothetical protein